MRITVFGAAGNAGSRIVNEALGRGHEVTAVVRDAARFAGLPALAGHRVGDAADPEDVRRLAAGQDVVITATRPPRGREHELASAARGLLAGLAGSGVRLLVVGGAGSLTVPGSGGRLLVDDPAYVPAGWRDIALGGVGQLDVFRAEEEVDWAYVSPPAVLEPGTRTGRYRLGRDELLVGADGTSMISMEDLAVALVDEAEAGRYRRERFTVVTG
ncbi:NAD(P)H-binding protein [Streptomyces uncialis]|uniref:NAD(P)-dependent oxidoreductase n=1 Tax=Streptomyces uncialis TaxID=1048205 RepID=UPI002E33479F|nr:NAD(P)H-binding protein [Streptomyces uncialis]